MTIAFLIALYLFVGSLVALALNELTDVELTRARFIWSMAIWPVRAAHFVMHLVRLLLLGLQ